MSLSLARVWSMCGIRCGVRNEKLHFEATTAEPILWCKKVIVFSSPKRKFCVFFFVSLSSQFVCARASRGYRFRRTISLSELEISRWHNVCYRTILVTDQLSHYSRFSVDVNCNTRTTRRCGEYADRHSTEGEWSKKEEEEVGGGGRKASKLH